MRRKEGRREVGGCVNCDINHFVVDNPSRNTPHCSIMRTAQQYSLRTTVSLRSAEEGGLLMAAVMIV